MVELDFVPRGVCPRTIHVAVSDDGQIIENVAFDGGCNGNTKAVALLVEGQRVDDVVALLAGNDCKGRGTSCADQMTKALLEAQAIAVGAGA